MATDLAVEPTATTTGANSESHLTCCRDDDTALCGSDVSGEPWNVGTETSCAVCADLEHMPVDMNVCPLTSKLCPLD